MDRDKNERRKDKMSMSQKQIDEEEWRWRQETEENGRSRLEEEEEGQLKKNSMHSWTRSNIPDVMPNMPPISEIWDFLEYEEDRDARRPNQLSIRSTGFDVEVLGKENDFSYKVLFLL